MKLMLNIKTPIKKNAFLVQIFIGLSLLSVIIVTIISGITFYVMKNKSMEDINKINKMSLENTDAVFSSNIKSFQNYSIELYQNPNIRKIMFMDELEWDSGMENAVRHIQNILSMNRIVMNSVYVLNNKETILSISEQKFAASDSDRQLFHRVSNLRTGDSPLVWTMEDKYSGNEIKTMTFFFHQGIPGSLGGAVAVNIDLEALSKTMFSEKINKNQNMFIVDRSGNVVLHSDPSMVRKNILNESYFSTILHSDKNYDSFTVGSKNKAVSYSYITTINNRFYVISEMNNVHTLSELAKIRNVIIISGALIFMLALFVAGFISYYVYKPFGHVIRNIRSIYQEHSAESRPVDELQLVSEAFTSIVQRNHNLKRENVTHTFVKMLNSKRGLDKQGIEKIFMDTESIQDKDTPYGVFVVTLDNFDNFSERSNVEAVSFRLDSVITLLTDTIQLNAQCALYTVGQEQVLCILSSPDDKVSLHDDFLMEIARNAQESILKMLNMDVSIGISSIMNRPDMIIEAYKEGLEVTRHRIVEGSRWIANAKFLSTLRKVDIPESAARDIVNAVMRGDHEQYEVELDSVAVYSRGYQYASILRFFTQVSYTIMKLSQDLLIEETINSNSTYFEIHNRISEFKDYSELKAWFQELFHQSSTVIQEILNKKTRDVLPESLEYISLHYCDGSISVNSVAEKMKISASYFSKMFNEAMGYTFPEYVNHLRLEKAKELLQEYPELSINDISTTVGYSSSSYFTTSFKKKYGVSPSKIRILHKN